jgi:DNA-binding transcriptional LysR family regulator
VLDAVRRKCQQLNLILRAFNQPELIQAIEQDELDVVISLIPDKLGPGLRSMNIIELPLILLAPRNGKVRSAKDLWAAQRVTEPLISLNPNEIICQMFQQTLTRLGISWLPRIEMDALDLIEKYVEAGFGIGLSVRVPGKKFPSTIRVLDLKDFPPVRLGVIYRERANSDSGVRRVFLDEVRRQAAGIKGKIA